MENETVSPTLVRRIFLGKEGIRAGWSIGVFAVILGVMTAVFFFPVKYFLETSGFSLNDASPMPVGGGELAGLLGLLSASMIMTRIEHKSLIAYGLEGNRRPLHFLLGVLSGIVALSVLVGALSFGGFLVLDGQSTHGWNAVQYALSWGGVFLLVGLYEEYLMRGYLQATLTRGIGFWWSAVILSSLFGCIHLLNPGESPVGIVAAALVGFVFCVSLWSFKTLWWAIGFHAAWDWSESYFWGTSDSGRVLDGHLFAVHPQGNILWSGGATGPEGSVMVFPLLAIVALLLWIVGRNKAGHQTTQTTT